MRYVLPWTELVVYWLVSSEHRRMTNDLPNIRDLSTPVFLMSNLDSSNVIMLFLMAKCESILNPLRDEFVEKYVDFINAIEAGRDELHEVPCKSDLDHRIFHPGDTVCICYRCRTGSHNIINPIKFTSSSCPPLPPRSRPLNHPQNSVTVSFTP